MNRTAAIRLAFILALGILAYGLARSGLPVVSFLASALLAVVVAIAAVWLIARMYQAFLWKVGRRLAFSYFLIGVLPIPMVALLALGTTWLLGNFFLGHLYRDALEDFQGDFVASAEERLAELVASGRPGPATAGGVAFGYYRQGRRIGGAGSVPATWPSWLTEQPAESPGEASPVRLVRTAGSGITAAVAVEQGELGVTAVLVEDLATVLRKRSGLWVELAEPGAGGEPGVVTFQERQLRFRPLAGAPEGDEIAEDKREFFRARAAGEGDWDRPLLAWPHLGGPLVTLAEGEVVARRVESLVTSTPRTVAEALFAASAEQNLYAWLGLLTVAAVLLTVYAVAVLVALAMIFGLSRAVNALSRATRAVSHGDFSATIPVRRRDQIGELQRSFNEMASHLENLVATAAQKEILERELGIARELQESLLPRNLPRGEAVEFATLFEPSAAIGGDYFDILRLDEKRLAVVIADVSGHGLSSGLRMAMLKAALLILVEQGERPEVILERLDALVRSNQDQHFFVTATLGLVDLEGGRLELFNAGHPPTYLLRGGEVREILLPGSPLGCLGNHYGHEVVALERDDLVVWLSDGLIEAADAAGEPFGYERIVAALRSPATSPLEVRNRLLSAVSGHTAGRPAGDDRTLVVMRYRAPATVGEALEPAAASTLSAPSPSRA